MAISVETSVWPGVLLIWETLVLTLLQTVFDLKRFRKTCSDDLSAARRYFLSFFVLGLALPLIAIFLLAASPSEVLGDIGLRLGRWKLGLILVLASVPVAWLVGKVGTGDPEMRAFYPFSKKALADAKTFLGYEATYFLFYYTAWEFIFRGILFFPLAVYAGFLPALAVSVLTSTLFHIGHPDTEIFGALGGGLIFGFVAWQTGSFLYLIPIHAFIGIATDSCLFKIAARERSRL